MLTKDLINNPELVYEVPEYELELVAREVVERSIERSRSTKGKLKKRVSVKEADKLMVFIGAVFNRSPLFACTLVVAFAGMGGNVNALIRSATSRKRDPNVRGFLDYLRAHLNPNGRAWTSTKPPEAWIVRPAEERACMWQGLDAAETRKKVQHIRR